MQANNPENVMLKQLASCSVNSVYTATVIKVVARVQIRTKTVTLPLL
jgi:hypothetical protein